MSKGRRTIGLEDLGDRLPGGALRCGYALGCPEPVVEGRWLCLRHAADVDRRAQDLIQDANRKSSDE